MAGTVRGDLRALRGLEQLPLEGMSEQQRQRIRKDFATVEARTIAVEAAQGPQRDVAYQALGEAIETVLTQYDQCRSVQTRDFAERVDAALNWCPLAELRVVAGHARLLAGLQLGRASHYSAALPEYERAVLLLNERSSPRGIEYWAYALQQAIRLQVERDLDAACNGLRSLCEEAAARFSPYVRNRALEATVLCTDEALHGRPELVPALCLRALALSRAEPNAYTGAALISLTSHHLVALKKLGRFDEAVAVATSLSGLRSGAQNEESLLELTTSLYEAAHMAVDLNRHSDALLFLMTHRDLLSGEIEPALQTEHARGVLLEGRCRFVMGDKERSLVCCDEVFSLTRRTIERKQALWAYVASEVLRGEILAAEGNLQEARTVWRSVVDRFDEDFEKPVMEEVERAQQLLVATR